MWGNFKDKQCKYAFKVVLIGDSGVGKSSMFSRFIKNEFNQEFKSTIGAGCASHNLNVNEDIIMAIIWDSAGHYRYDSTLSADYRGAEGALLVYDITRKVTFENLESWLKEIRCHTDQNIVIVLIGNKADLDHLREVQTNDAKAFAERENIGIFMETSALDSLNVVNAFTKVFTQIYHNNRNKDKGKSREKTCDVTGTSSLNYLHNDMKCTAFKKKELLKEHPSKEPEDTPEIRGPMVEKSNEAGSGNIGSNVEIKKSRGTTEFPLHDSVEVVEDIEKVLSREKALIYEKSKLAKSYDLLLNIYMKNLDELVGLEKDRNMLITKVIPLVVRKLRRSPEYCSALAKLQGFAIRLGRQQYLEAFQEAYHHTEELENSDPTATAKFEAATKEFEELEFSYVKEVSSNADRTAKQIMNIEPSQDLPQI